MVYVTNPEKMLGQGVWRRLLATFVITILSAGTLGVTQAVADSFTSEAASTSLVGWQTAALVLTTDTGKAECSTSIFTGEAEGKMLESLELTPTYSGCTAFGFSATFTTNGCKYKLYAAGTADLVCPSGKDIVIDTTANACNVTIQPQTGLTSITYGNGTSNGKADITAEVNITNIKYTESGGACAQSGKSTTGGKLAGQITLTGQDASTSEATGISQDIGYFTSESSKALLSGQQIGTNMFVADTGDVTCNVVSFGGEITATSVGSIQLVPTYSECTVFGVQGQVTMNGCFYQVHAIGIVDLVCSAGKDIVIDTVFNTCNVTIPAQTGLTGTSFVNATSGGKGDITAELNITNIKYTESGLGCKYNGKATTGGSVSGRVTVTAKDQITGNPSGISVDSEAPADTFTSQSPSTTLSGSQVGTSVLITDAWKIECTSASFHGEATGVWMTSVELAPTYSGCTHMTNATVTTNGCTWKLHAAGTADLVCPAGKDILVDTEFNACNVTIPAQTGLSGVTFVNATSGGKGDIAVKLNITNIKYEEISGFTCAASGKATTGSLTSEITISGKDAKSGSPTGIAGEGKKWS